MTAWTKRAWVADSGISGRKPQPFEQFEQLRLGVDESLRRIAPGVRPYALLLVIRKRRDAVNERSRKLADLGFLERSIQIWLLKHRFGLPRAVLEEDLTCLIVSQDSRKHANLL